MVTLAEIATADLDQLSAWLTADDASLRADAACAIGDQLRTTNSHSLPDPTRETLRALLDDRADFVRLEAAITLAEARDPACLGVLLAAMERRAQRLDAVRALGRAGNAAAVPPLRKLMLRWLLPWADRMQAAAALCALGDQSGAEYLEARLSSRRFEEAAAAVHFLGECRHPEARTLLSALAGTRGPLQEAAVRAIGTLGDATLIPLLESLRAQANAELGEDIDSALDELRGVLCP